MEHPDTKQITIEEKNTRKLSQQPKKGEKEKVLSCAAKITISHQDTTNSISIRKNSNTATRHRAI